MDRLEADCDGVVHIYVEGTAMMEDLVNALAELQAERKMHEAQANQITDDTGYDRTIEILENELAQAKKCVQELRRLDEIAMGELDVEIKNVSAQIIDTWDGEKRTVRYGAGLLKFRTTTSLKIHDKQEPRVLEDLLDHFNTPKAIMEYISGFNKTKLRAYMVIHPLPSEVAELVSKTTVKLEVEK